MRFDEIFSSEQCKGIFEKVNRFTSALLKEYNDQIEDIGFFWKAKDIFDFVWGTVELNAVEISLLDSPLLQRLRNIKQLGFGHYVYCNADYSRFAHTIGVIEISGRMANVVTKRLKQAAINSDIFNMREVVRLAAIMHDCGHLFFSHVSESYFAKNKKYKNNQAFTDALIYFNEQISTRASFHEMISTMIVNSEEVLRFFSLTAKYLEHSKIITDENVDLLIDYISGLIVGTAVDKNILPFSMIIKGAIDADRMDYLSRDSCVTRVPLAVDIGRLINKITVVKLDSYQPSQVWNDHTNDDQPYQSMAIQYSAQRLIWQLSMARAIMYQSIYFHHKKLTAEAMFRRACEIIFSLIPDFDFDKIMLLSDQVFNEHFSSIIIPPDLSKTQECLDAKEILLRIRDRNLYKRVASFSHDSIDSTPNYIYETFVINIIENPFSNEYTKFMDALVNEYYKVIKYREKPTVSKPPVFMFIEANWKNEMSDDIPIDFGNAPYKMSSQVFKETPTFGEENRQKQYYLVTDQNDRDAVYIALERTLYVHYGIRISESSATCAKFTSEQIEKVKFDLFNREYYKDSLCLLPDRIIKRLYDSKMFQNVVTKYQTYNGVNNAKVTADALFSYLRQFLLVSCSKDEIKYLLDGVLRLLEGATFIDRNFFSENASSLMKRILEKGYKSNLMVKLGGAFDSANRLTYYFNDVKEKDQFRFVETVPDALKLSDERSCIVFFDDGAYSGKQVVSIFQELMGIPIDQRETNEKHAKELDIEGQELLKSSKIILAYICFNNQSESIITKKLLDLGIKNVEIIYERNLSQKIFAEDNCVFSSPKQRDLVREKFAEIGYQVQRSSKLIDGENYKERWNEERVKEAALGYNDAQQIVFFEFNVPTYTLTPFWQNGEYKGKPWKGLFQRTEK